MSPSRPTRTPPRSYRGGARGSSPRRLRLGFLAIAMVVSVFGARLVQLQAVDPHAYAVAAAEEGTVTAVLPAERGEIVDRNGEAFATSVEGRMLVADPELTREQAPEIASFLADRLGIDYFDTREALTRDSRFAYIARHVPATLAEDVLDEADGLGYDGLGTRLDEVRAYPADDVAANVVGFTGNFEPTENGGTGGLELTFEGHLAGTDGEEKYVASLAAADRIPLGDNVTVKPVDGQDLRLTLDRDVQWYVQRVLAQTVRGADADQGIAVVMDTRTGELIALADYPTFDPNAMGESPESDWGARSLSDPFEPGSVEKALTMSALLDQGKVTPRTRVEVPPQVEVMGQRIGDYFVHGTLDLTLTGVLAKSSNIGTVKASRHISSTLLHRYLRSFGLGARTDIGVRGESAGRLPAASSWTDLTRATVSFGQGLSVNAVQMAAAINTIANGGVYVSPSLVQGSATTDAGQVVGTDVATTRRVVGPAAARDAARMMERVLDPEEGVAPGAAIPPYRVAGKTGTAQVVDPDCGCYADGVFNVSFAGFAPADDPRFTVYVMVSHPRNGGGGGAVAGPAFQRIMSRVLQHYGIPPTGSKPSRLPICGGRAAAC